MDNVIVFRKYGVLRAVQHHDGQVTDKKAKTMFTKEEVYQVKKNGIKLKYNSGIKIKRHY